MMYNSFYELQVLEYWAGRGMLQIFVAVMTRAFPVYSVEQRELILLQDAASYLLLACGAVYVVSVSLVNNTLFPNLILELRREFIFFCSLLAV
ncbi:hypothetical protein IC582_017596 [Cucumis melo]